MADRYDALAPKDIVITLRSLRRRFSEVIAAVQADPELLARVDEPGPEGQSLGPLVSGIAGHVDQLASQIDLLARNNDAVVPTTVLTGPSASSERLALERAAALIGDRADAAADVLDRLEADGWNRSATTDSGDPIDMVTLARTAARVSIEGLRTAERQRDWLRSG